MPPQHTQLTFRRPSPPTAPVIALMVIAALGWLAALFAPVREIVRASLLLDGGTLPQLELWAIATYSIFQLDLLGVVLELLMIYLFGSDLARSWGGTKWSVTMLAAILVGGLLGALIAWPFGTLATVGGLGAVVTACIAAYCWQVWNQRVHLFFIELTGKSMLALFVAIDFVFALLSFDPTRLFVQLGGLLVGLAVASGVWRPKQLLRRYHYWRVKRNLSLVAKSPETDPMRGKKHDPTRQRKDGTWIN